MYLLSGATCTSLHHLAILTEPSLSFLLCFLCMLTIPIFPFLKLEEFLIYLSRLLFSIHTGSNPSIHVYTSPSPSPLLFPHCMRFVTKNVNIFPHVFNEHQLLLKSEPLGKCMLPFSAIRTLPVVPFIFYVSLKKQ